ncbi:MAG: nitroreductase family protein [Clostridia bacterium]|nr:nitroreductase family protein [Clostridia bacterium]
MEFRDLLNQRYSVRKYSNKEVADEKINKIVDAGRIAPTATNSQPQRFLVLKTEEALKKFDEVSRMRYGAPVVIVVLADMNNVWESSIEPGYNTSEMDASIACTYMMLETVNQGLGCVWVRYFNSEELRNIFDLSDNLKPICVLPVGYPSDDSTPAEKHSIRNNLEDIVTYM